jgi:hypothetical protein
MWCAGLCSAKIEAVSEGDGGTVKSARPARPAPIWANDAMRVTLGTEACVSSPVATRLACAARVHSAWLYPILRWCAACVIRIRSSILTASHSEALFTCLVLLGIGGDFPGPPHNPGKLPTARLPLWFLRVCSRPIPDNPSPNQRQPVYLHTRPSPRVWARNEASASSHDRI